VVSSARWPSYFRHEMVDVILLKESIVLCMRVHYYVFLQL